ncbi:acetolactate synthase catalytic subunit [Peptococcaceae bacterium SCADC1_2_3]|nr:acetolactate synthase catalytic subunit [Peptococcaceae bacterium SCADC1_2_3]HBQ29018.1 biosynthetic-type acetolactate synthase large subunit [Desulfotomaculum sp.]
MRKSGGEILIDSLLKEGVDTIFGYPGGAVLPIYDALYESNIRHILTRHEQGAAHAADGYARASGRPGVCLATSGPGATNLVTGIANAYMDSVSLVAFTGQVATSVLGKDSFQEADITGITMPITKHSYLIRDTRDIARVVKEAFYIATTGRPGPVLVDIPKDISGARVVYENPGPVNLRGYRPEQLPSSRRLKEAADLMVAAKRPVIYAGGGVVSSGAYRELRHLAELILAPVTTTLMGLGCFPGDHPLSLGMLGMHGSKYANYAICECDLLIALGVRFDDRVTGKIAEFAPKAKIIHLDIDAAEMGKNVRVNVPLVGDIKEVINLLVSNLKAKLPGAWQEQIGQWKKEFPVYYEENGHLKPQQVIQEIYNVTKGEAIITTEVGQHQMWTTQYYNFTRPRSFISSGGLGTMGFGLPAAIGAQVACPEAVVFNIAGDGSIQMNIQELATAVNYNLPVKIAIINNGYLGMVRQWQEFFYNRRYSYTELINPDFVKLAEAYGAVGIRVTEPKEVTGALKKAMAVKKPVVIDFVVEREENVLPMVPPGEALGKMLG